MKPITDLDWSSSAPDDDGACPLAAQLARFVARRGDVDGAKNLVARARELAGDAAIESVSGAWTRLCAGIVALACDDPEGARAELEPLATLELRPLNHAGPTPAIARARLAALLAGSEPERSRELALRARTELEQDLGGEHPETRAVVRLLENGR